jgi:glucose dehydrogenase
MSQLYREVQSIMNDCYMICSETGVRAVEQAVQQISPQQTKPLEETNSDASVLSAVLARNVSLSEDDLKNVDTFDVSVSYVQLHSQSYSSIAISRKYLDFYAQTHRICI